MGKRLAGWRKVWVRKNPRRHGTTWTVCYNDTDGSPVYALTLPDKGLVMSARTQWEMYLNGRGPEPQIGKRIGLDDPAPAPAAKTWQESVDEFLKRPSTGEKTVRLYRGTLNSFAASAHPLTVAEVTSDAIETWLSSLVEKKKAKATVGQRARTLKGFLDWSGNPSFDKKLCAAWKPFKQHRRARPHLYMPAEIDRILIACEGVRVVRSSDHSANWWKTFILTLNECGLRFNEACHLLWDEVDFVRGEIRVTDHSGLADVAPWKPKTEESVRTVPMVDRLAHQLLILQGDRDKTNPYVFVEPGRYRYLKDRSFDLGTREDILHGVRHHFVELRGEAGIAEGCLHDFRRSFITHGMMGGMTVKEMQVLAGHASETTTLRIYAQTVETSNVIARYKEKMQGEVPRRPEPMRLRIAR